MNLPYYQQINQILQDADIEGFIASGAPLNEYETEAQQIASALSEIQNIDLEIITSIISLIWVKNFDLSENEITQRAHEIQNIAQSILTLCRR